MASNKFIATSAKNPCPVCDRTTDGDCRLVDDGRVFCHTHNDKNQRVGQEFGEEKFRFAKLTSDGLWGIFIPAEKWNTDRSKGLKFSSSYFDEETRFNYTDKEGNPVVSIIRSGFETRLSPAGADLDSIIPYGWIEAQAKIEQVKEHGRVPTVFWVEGESTVDELAAMGIPVISIQGGCKGFRPGRDSGIVPPDVRIVLCPDRDRLGVGLMQTVAEHYPDNEKLWLRCFPGEPEFWNGKCPPSHGLDVGNWVDQLRADGLDKEEIFREIKGATSSDPIVLADEDVELDTSNYDSFLTFLGRIVAEVEDEGRQEHLARNEHDRLGLKLGKRFHSLLAQARSKARGTSIKRRGRRELTSSRQKSLWEGIVPSGGRSLEIVGLPKTRKTQTILNAISAWYHGRDSYLGRKFSGECPPVIIVGTDQAEEDWIASFERAGLPPSVGADDTPIVELWSQEQGLIFDEGGIAEIRDCASEYPGAIILCDSIRKLVIAPLGLNENDTEVLGPLQAFELALAPHKCPLVYIHHASLGGAQRSAANAGSGSTALGGHFTQIMKLTKVSQDSNETRTTVELEGRLGPEDKFHIDTVGHWSEWKTLGSDGDIVKLDKLRKAEEKLNDRQEEVLDELRECTRDREIITVQILAERLELQEQPVRRALTSLENKGLVRSTTRPTDKGREKVYEAVQLSPDTKYKRGYF